MIGFPAVYCYSTTSALRGAEVISESSYGDLGMQTKVEILSETGFKMIEVWNLLSTSLSHIQLREISERIDIQEAMGFPSCPQSEWDIKFLQYWKWKDPETRCVCHLLVVAFE